MSKTPEIVFLFDVDNTLIDNDRVQAHLSEHLEQTYGTATRDRYWELFEQLRSELGYADYLGALERYRLEDLHHPDVLRMSNWLVDYPFAERLYPRALDAVKHVQQWGTAVILSDGDAVFQPRKVERSGLWRAFDNRVLIYVHKEQELDDVVHLYEFCGFGHDRTKADIHCRCPVSFTTRSSWRLSGTFALCVLLNLLALEIEHEEAKRR